MYREGEGERKGNLGKRCLESNFGNFLLKWCVERRNVEREVLVVAVATLNSTLESFKSMTTTIQF